MKLNECLEILSIMVPEECLLIVHAVLYLKKVNWSNIVIKCPLHQKKNFEFSEFPKVLTKIYVQVPELCLLIVQCELHTRTVD